MPKPLYYLIATLPELYFGQRPTITPEEFLNACRGHLSADEFKLLESININEVKAEQEGGKPDVLQKWYRHEIGIRNRLVRLRAKRLGLTAERFLKGGSFAEPDAQFLSEVYNAKNPLEGQKKLDLKRWRFLESAQFNHYFDLQRIIIYLLKLYLLHEIALYDSSRGLEVLNDVTEVGSFETLISSQVKVSTQ